MSHRIRAFFVTDLRVSLRDGEQLLLTIGLPVLILVFFSLIDVLPTGTDEPVAFLAPGVLALGLLSVAFVRQAIGLGFDRGFGAIKRLAVTPLRVTEFLTAKALTTAVLFAGQFAVLSVVALALGWRPSPSPVLAVTIVLGLACFSALAMALASRFEGLAALAVANSLYILLLLLSGIVVRLDELPGWLATVVKALPSTAIASLFREQLDGSLGPGWAWVCLAGWTAVGMALAVRTFRWE